MDKYNIIDEEQNIIHSGTEVEMQRAYQVMVWDDKSIYKMHQEPNLQRLKDKYRVPGVIGKVSLVQA